MTLDEVLSWYRRWAGRSTPEHEDYVLAAYASRLDVAERQLEAARAAGQRLVERNDAMGRLIDRLERRVGRWHRKARQQHLELRSWKKEVGHVRRLDLVDGQLDDTVAVGLAHVEQLDDNQWFVSIGPLAFILLSAKPIKAIPRDFDTWQEAKEKL